MALLLSLLLIKLVINASYSCYGSKESGEILALKCGFWRNIDKHPCGICIQVSVMDPAFAFEPRQRERERSTYIVHLDKSFMPTIFASHHNWHSSIINTTKIEAPTTQNGHHPVTKLLCSYDNVLHGFTALFCPNMDLKLPTSHQAFFQLINTGLKLTLHTPLSFLSSILLLGYGRLLILVKMCEKLIGVNYFNKGLLVGDSTVKISMNCTRDTDGHGIHVASITAGNFAKGASYSGYAPGTARCMAPRARIAVYRCSFEEGTFTSNLIVAMDQAVADGVGIPAISYGWANIPLYKDSIAIASFGAIMKGVVVSAAAGNSGP
ncbi:hypothetical protein HAX54_013080 [Datura stramonium]|uniref:Uncharacterized protein n=1 Tax=Datura stramonium TaxID=4076 RepID=A0ABS8RY66_DATST|nr:hypothetical protein [Datura stramonium]